MIDPAGGFRAAHLGMEDPEINRAESNPCHGGTETGAPDRAIEGGCGTNRAVAKAVWNEPSDREELPGDPASGTAVTRALPDQRARRR